MGCENSVRLRYLIQTCLKFQNFSYFSSIFAERKCNITHDKNGVGELLRSIVLFDFTRTN